MSRNIAQTIKRLHGEVISEVRSSLTNAIRIGELLTEQKASLKHGQWLPWIEENLPFDRRTATNYMRLYAKREMVSHLENPTDAYQLLGVGNGAHVSNNSGQNEWYTPLSYIQAARAVMGYIDLDPASCNQANKIVQAKSLFTKEQDGLAQPWRGHVWLNPPYAQPLISQFADKAAREFMAGNTRQMCVLTNNATDSAWFHTLAQHASAICFPLGRIKFIDQHGVASGAPLQGQALFYFGESTDLFQREFQQFGLIYEPARVQPPAMELPKGRLLQPA